MFPAWNHTDMTQITTKVVNPERVLVEPLVCNVYVIVLLCFAVGITYPADGMAGRGPQVTVLDLLRNAEGVGESPYLSTFG
jgi:hypothetical protein